MRLTHVSALHGCRFKLALASTEERSAVVAATALTEATDGVDGGLPPQLNAQRVIGDYLRFLRNYAIAKLTSQYSGSFRSDDVTWALSVPAAWSESSKQTMRLAAVDAGIVEHVDSR